MDDATLTSLGAALEASPENEALWLVLLQAFQARNEAAQGVALLDRLRGDDAFAGLEARLVAAELYLAADRPGEALAWAGGDTPKERLVAARACLALGHLEEGLEAYEAAVAASPALEDTGLRAQLASSRVVHLGGRKEGAGAGAGAGSSGRDGKGAGEEEGASRPRLRVIANDDTDASEVIRLLQPQQAQITFADVAGLDAVKEQIRRRIILPFQKPTLFQRFRKRVGGGILLYGPPGVGKTLIARATAGECDAAFFNVSIADVLDMYIGESERKLHALFEQARQKTPAVLFFDEIEALGAKRQYSREGTSAKLVSQFLSEMDGFTQANSGVLIMGATNTPWAIDPAFRRPGRFDRVQFVPPPDQAAREAILALHLQERPLPAGGLAALDLPGIARQSTGFSGADLFSLVETATDIAIDASLERGEEVGVDAKMLRAALKEVKPTTLEWLTTARNYARYANEGGQYDDVLAFLDKHGK